MKPICFSLLLILVLLCTAGCSQQEPSETLPAETVAATETTSETTTPETLPPQTAEATMPETTQPLPVLELTEEEQALLLQIAMAERNAGLGEGDCPICMALVMRTVLNRVESGRFSKSIRGVLYAQEQFTPVMDGSFENAVPNDACREALDMVLCGWDESQGCLYYEFCDGPSWHSRNLNLLTQHCNTRFYN